jgi:5-methylthioribose kinase
MRRLWSSRPDATWTDSFLDAWLAQIREDSIGFAGCKAIRRVIGLAKVSDIETLPHPEHVKAAAIVLGTARTWIKSRGSMSSLMDADDVFDTVAAAVLNDGAPAAYRDM